MREIFNAVREMGQTVPRRQATFYSEKLWREESGEFFEAVSNTPTPEDLKHAKEEGADAIICVVQAWDEMGITPEQGNQAILDKAAVIAQRPLSHFERGIRGEGIQRVTDSLATGYFAPEAVLQRQIAKVRFELQKEASR